MKKSNGYRVLACALACALTMGGLQSTAFAEKPGNTGTENKVTAPANDKNIIAGEKSEHPYSYVLVTLDADGGEFKGETKFWVNPEAEVTIPVKANPTSKDASKNFVQWDKPLKQKFSVDTKIYAVYWSAVVPGENTKHPDSYVLVTLDPTEKGSMGTNETKFWVDPTQTVTIPAADPTAKNPNQHRFTNWAGSKVGEKPSGKYAQATTIKAEYKTYDDIIPVPENEHNKKEDGSINPGTPENPPKDDAGNNMDIPKGYILVELDPTEKGTLSGNHFFYVTPDKKVKIPAGKVTPKNPNLHSFTKWDQELEQKFEKATKISAEYKEWDPVIPGKDSEHPEGFKLVTLDPTDKGTLEGEHDFWVNPDVEVTIPAGKVTPKKADEPFARWDKPLKGKFTDNTTITGLYGNEAHITPQTGIDGNMLMTVGAGATATISGLAGAAYVAMKNRKKH